MSRPSLPNAGHFFKSLLAFGFSYGEMPSNIQLPIAKLPHNISQDDLVKSFFPSTVVAMVEFCHSTWPQLDSPSSGSVIVEFGEVLVGPRQSLLLQAMRSYGYEIRLSSAFRSPTYQWLLFCVQYLTGTLLDCKGRYNTLPAPWSDHCVIDGAMDVRTSQAFVLALYELGPNLPFSIYRPYIDDPLVATELWHWKTTVNPHELKHLSMCSEIFPKGLSIEGLRGLKEYFDVAPTSHSMLNSCHIFVHGLSPTKTKCVGSKKLKISLSVSDATNAVGDFQTRVITIPHGYTPVMDGRLEDAEVGACVYHLIDQSSERNGVFMTGYSSLQLFPLEAKKVEDALQIKAELFDGDKFRMEKSAMDEILIVESEIFPFELGIPKAGFYRYIDCPLLVKGRFDAWLRLFGDGKLPAYSTPPDRYYAHDETMLAHTAFLLLYLSEQVNLDTELRSLQKDVFNYMKSKLFSFHEQPLISEELSSAMVFYIHALSYIDEGAASNAFAEWDEYFFSLLTAENSERRKIFNGHFCAMLTKIQPDEKNNSKYVDFFARYPVREQFFELIYSKSAAQIIRYMFENAVVGAEDYANELLGIIVRHPSSSYAHNFGSFLGYENFQSAIPIEAFEDLAVILDLNRADDYEFVLPRLLEAVGFLGRMQYDGSESLTHFDSLPRSGAMPYSLQDRGIRLDFGIHAARAARVVNDFLELVAL